VKNQEQMVRISEMTTDLERSMLDLITKRHKHFKRLYKVSVDATTRYDESFAIALRKVLREVENKWSREKRPRQFIHLFCGAQFANKDELQQHAMKGNCRPSRQTIASCRARDRILREHRENERIQA
jgi:hypothetical protein